MDATSAAEQPRRSAPRGSSFYTAMRILPRAQREAMFEIYASAARSTTSPTRPGRAPQRLRAARSSGAPISTRSMAAPRRPRSPAWPARCATSICAREDFLAVIDGMEMDVGRRHPRARLRHARPLLRPGGERGRTAFGPRVRHGARTPASARASSRPRAAAHQHPARHRRGRRASAASICRAKRCRQAGIATTDPATVLAQSRRSAQACADVVDRARRRISREADAIMAAQPAPRGARAAHHGRRLSLHPRPPGRARLRCAAPPRRLSARASSSGSAALRFRLMPRTVHIIGAGLAGLAAAVGLTGRGGNGRRARGHRLRRRALPLLSRRGARHDDRQRQSSAAVGQSRRARLSAQRSAPTHRLVGPPQAEFPFVDLAERRALDAALQRRPLAVVDFRRSAAACPDTHALDYLPLAPAAVGRARQAGRRGHPVAAARSTSGWCGRCCWRRSTSTRPRARRGSQARSSARRSRRGGQACRPLIARDGLARR